MAQLKAAIRSGELAEGQALPPARDLAEILKINRNTVWAAYRELAGQGWLESRVGAGTFVAPGRVDEEAQELKALFQQTALQALEGGAGVGLIGEQLQNLAAELTKPLTGQKVLVVECNQEGLDLIAGELEQSLGLSTQRALIQDLEANPARTARLAKEVDLVVAGLNHATEFRAVTPDETIPLTGVLLRAEMAVMNRLTELPAGSRVGFVCINNRSTLALFKDYLLESGSTLRKVWAGLDDPTALAPLLSDSRLIYASSFAYPAVKRLAGPKREVISVELGVDRAGLEAVRQRLVRLKLEKALKRQEDQRP